MEDTVVQEKLEAIWPEVIGAVITKRGDKVNLCPINYQAISSKYETPLTVCIGLDNRGYSLETILQTNEFVYAYPSKEQLKQTLYCGTVSGRDMDKLAHTDFVFTNSDEVRPPILTGAVMNFECRVVHTYNAGDFTIVIGEICKMHSSGKGNLEKIYALGGMKYGGIKDLEVIQEGR